MIQLLIYKNNELFYYVQMSYIILIFVWASYYKLTDWKALMLIVTDYFLSENPACFIIEMYIIIKIRIGEGHTVPA